jgi:GlpG protein
MRLIGHLPDERAARVFGDFLYVQGIENQLESQQRDGWAIWILDEDRIGRAESLLTEFRSNPTDPKYAAEGKSAAERRAEVEKDKAAYQKRLRNRRHLFRPLTAYGFGPLTFALIVASVAAFILSKGGDDLTPIMGLPITSYSTTGSIIEWLPGLPEVHHGEVWRLITPIFIHYGIMHIFFNMLWLRDLGSMIEGRQSTLHLLIMVVVFAAGSNFAQYYFRGPAFGGMSGVVYALLGYIWIRGKFDPGSGLFLHPTTVTTSLVWFVLCFTGVLGSVANFAHGAGLLMGVAWGYLSSLKWR